MILTREQWAKAEVLFERCMELSKEERDVLLSTDCVDDPIICEAVRALLDSASAAGSFLNPVRGMLPNESGLRIPALTVGRLLSERFTVLEFIGAGGMGEVYRARDERLKRIVAVKILNAESVHDRQWRIRFEREAKAISNLNHPHICTVYDFGLADGQQYLVMECLDGETLAHRLLRGPMRLPELLLCATDVADALSHAHRHGLIHRDLKPGNIMLTKSGAKVLDFGLARAVQIPHSEDTLPVTEDLTMEGAVIGTYPYMSPEQLQAGKVDARSDIFAFGAVLHEMATGQRAFQGETSAGTIAAVLEVDPPPVSDLRPGLPPALAWAVKTCLRKDPADRWQTAHDLTLLLEKMREDQLELSVVRSQHRRKSWMGTAIAIMGSLLCVIVATGVWWRWNRPQATSDAFILQITPPAGAIFAAPPNSSVPVIGLSVSPEGSKIAFVAERNGTPMIWVRTMNAPQAEPLPGTEGGQQPFWSPDGGSIAFFANNSLKKVDITGRGDAVTLAEVSADPRGGAWLNSGVIIYAPSNLESLLQVPAGGGQATAVFADKRGQRWWPSALPDGKQFIFYSRSGGGLFAGSLTGSVSKRILETNWAGVYVDPSYLLYLRDGVLMAQRFDAKPGKSFTLQGAPVPIAEHVGGATNAMPGFSASRSGLLAYSHLLVDSTRIIRYDRRGTFASALTESGQYMDPRISPDGRKVAWSRVDPAQLAQDIWVFNFERGTTTRITFDPGIEASPTWSPDSWRLLYRCNRTGLINLYIRDLRTGKDAPIFDHERQWQVHEEGTQNAAPTDWSSDGRYIIYTAPARTGFDLFRLTLTPNAVPEALARSGFNEIHGAISPDSQRLAFSSDESGRFEIYLQSFPEGKGKQLVSIKGGTEPHWRTDGRELYFLDPAGKVMAAGINAAGEATKPQELFSVRTPAAHAYRQDYDSSPDGQWFVVNTVVDNHAEANITVMTNWLALSKLSKSGL